MVLGAFEVSKPRFKSWCVATIISLATLAPACLNDRDTLADEAKKNRDILTTLVGGFERNPPLYYQMRIDRINKDLAKDPKLIDEYDDIAVANDRIGNDDEAIKWIELKKKQLAPLNMKDEKSKDEWYRYYANCGTFWAHRWFHNGSDSKKIKDVERSRDLIARALDINPDAHFGREKYQLAVLKWIVYCRKGAPVSLAYFIQGWEFENENGLSHSGLGMGIHNANVDKAVTGLSGLIRLGGAWQSADIYIAIGSLLNLPIRPSALSSVAILRAKEILDAGGKSIDPKFSSIEGELYKQKHISPINASEMGEYRRLRNLADKWNADRQAFMIAKLKKGDHPDTDPHFWDGAPPTPDFSVHQSIWTYLTAKVFTPMNMIYMVCPGLPILLFAWACIRSLIRKRRPNTPA
jgi:tetratricopeptide (TPR) repeat protein